MDAYTNCRENQGPLPACGALAYPYIPTQPNAGAYPVQRGVVRGTLFPGLDLPLFQKGGETELSLTPIHQLQALNFALTELGLYLDTHPQDQEAVDLLHQYANQYAYAMQQYELNDDALTQLAAALDGTYQWSQGPWPWEYTAEKEA